MDIREEAKGLGIKNWHNKKPENLGKEIEGLKNQNTEENSVEVVEPIKVSKTVLKYEYEETTNLMQSDKLQKSGWQVYEMPMVDGVLTHKLRKLIG